MEENAGTWGTLYMRSELHVSGSLAASGYITAMAFHFLGRVSGDALVNRFGQRRMALFGGLLVAVGVAVAFPSPLTTVFGYASAGYGVATVIPSVFEAADALPGFKPGTALTVTLLVLRVGFLVAPPLVGLIADASAVRWGLLCVCAAGLLVAGLAWVLSPGREPSDVPVGATR
nr:MFS transporter [Aestuariimicrobium sp. p3-SID1156]